MYRTLAFAAVLLSSSLAAQDDEDKGLLPPAAVDRSGRVSAIRTALFSGDLRAAEMRIEELIRAEQGNFEGPFWRGYLDLQRRNYFDAIRALRRAEALENNAWVLKVLAVSYYSARQYRLFLLKMNEALRKVPDDFAPHYYLGRYYESDRDDFRTAAAHFTEALKRNPKHFRSHYHLGYCQEMTREPELAEQQYRRAMELSEEYDMPYQGLARLRLAAQKPSEALVFALRAVELGPKEAANHALLAKAYFELQRNTEAAREWERNVELDPTDASALYGLYRAYRALEETEKAQAALERFKVISVRYGN